MLIFTGSDDSTGYAFFLILKNAFSRGMMNEKYFVTTKVGKNNFTEAYFISGLGTIKGCVFHK
jgi:hypothetical protein